MSSVKSNSQAITKTDLKDATKIIKEFVNPQNSDEQSSEKVSFSNKQYSFEITKIEVLDDMSNTSNGVGKANNGLYPLTKLLKDVEKSYDKGKKRYIRTKEFKKCSR